MKFLRKNLVNILLLLVLLCGIFYWRAPLWQNLQLLVRKVNQLLAKPCAQPLVYSLGQIDLKFKLSNDKVLQTLKQATDIWSKAAGKQLFVYQAGGDLKINFIYDYRQEATDKLKKLGITVTDDKNSYDTLKARYTSLQQTYLQQKASLEVLSKQIEQRKAAYEAEVKLWNRRQGAPPEVVQRLEVEKAALEQLVKDFNFQAAELNALVDNLNAEATVLNKLIHELNLDVANYNAVGQSVGQEFNEGLYITDEQGRRIDIYEFDSQLRLLRLLTHELGHALGLEHSENPADVMYRLNQVKNEKLTDNDVAALKARCQIK